MTQTDAPHKQTPGFVGIMGLIAGTFVVSVLITLVTGEVRHWVPVVIGVLVGLWAVQSINKAPDA